MKDSTVKDFVKAIKSEKASPIPYDTTAKVVRVDGDTVWVHIAGGVDETPVQKTVNAKVGDSVQVRIGGGKAWITGNSTAPPTDDEKANIADGKATKARAEATVAKAEATEAKETANAVQGIAVQASEDASEAKSIADNTNQYFWNEETGTDTGAHITEVPQDEWNDSTSPNYHSGGNLLIRSNGIAVREALKELAAMSKDGFDAKTYDASDNEVIIAHLGYDNGNDGQGGTQKAPYYTLGTRSGNVGNWSMAEGVNTEASGYCSHAEGYETIASELFSHAEGGNTEASGVYGSHAEGYHTTASGRYGSHAEGQETIASGDMSHAEGQGSIASGQRSHAEGSSLASGYCSHSQNNGTKASSDNQTALGKFNIEDNANIYAVIIGNGTASNARSNALTVDWSGNVDIAGKYCANNAQIGSCMSRTGSGNQTLTTTAATVSMNATADMDRGNVFDESTNGIKCLYSGLIHVIASVRYTSGFTVNDYMSATIYKGSTAVKTSRVRTPFAVYGGDVIIDAYLEVSANDDITIRARNETGGRGTVDKAVTRLTACYVSA